MKLIKTDNTLYLDRETKVFFSDEEIPKKFLDPTKYFLVVVNKENGYIERLGEKIYSEEGTESSTYSFKKSS